MADGEKPVPSQALVKFVGKRAAPVDVSLTPFASFLTTVIALVPDWPVVEMVADGLWLIMKSLSKKHTSDRLETGKDVEVVSGIVNRLVGVGLRLVYPNQMHVAAGEFVAQMHSAFAAFPAQASPQAAYTASLWAKPASGFFAELIRRSRLRADELIAQREELFRQVGLSALPPLTAGLERERFRWLWWTRLDLTFDVSDVALRGLEGTILNDLLYLEKLKKMGGAFKDLPIDWSRIREQMRPRSSEPGVQQWLATQVLLAGLDALGDSDCLSEDQLEEAWWIRHTLDLAIIRDRLFDHWSRRGWAPHAEERAFIAEKLADAFEYFLLYPEKSLIEHKVIFLEGVTSQDRLNQRAWRHARGDRWTPRLPTSAERIAWQDLDEAEIGKIVRAKRLRPLEIARGIATIRNIPLQHSAAQRFVAGTGVDQESLEFLLEDGIVDLADVGTAGFAHVSNGILEEWAKREASMTGESNRELDSGELIVDRWNPGRGWKRDNLLAALTRLSPGTLKKLVVNPSKRFMRVEWFYRQVMSYVRTEVSFELRAKRLDAALRIHRTLGEQGIYLGLASYVRGLSELCVKRPNASALGKAIMNFAVEYSEFPTWADAFGNPMVHELIMESAGSHQAFMSRFSEKQVFEWLYVGSPEPRMREHWGNYSALQEQYRAAFAEFRRKNPRAQRGSSKWFSGA